MLRTALKIILTAVLLNGVTGCADLGDLEVDADSTAKNNGATDPTQDGRNQLDVPDALDLRILLTEQGVAPLDEDNVPRLDDPKVQLGRALFFDKALSGGQDIACADCHHPVFGTSDGLPTSIGVGGEGLGPDRALHGDHAVIPRNAPDLFNRGSKIWETMFWDARVAEFDGYIESPAGTSLPAGLDSVLAAQALFPPTSADEMRGHPGANEIADIDNSNVTEIWTALTERILSYSEYVAMFAEAYPETPLNDITFAHAANALAAFEISAFTKTDSPFGRFLKGNDYAMSDQAMRGAALFYGEAGCSSCHSGSLLTDQKTHCIATPQLGPGKDDGQDLGRFLETDNEDDMYAFRTPPLHNVELTGPYMHSGAYATLEDAIRHHVAPGASLDAYTGTHLQGSHSGTVINNSALNEELIAYLDPEMASCESLTDQNVDDLVAFLKALTDESARDMSSLVPTSVPSGLPVF